MSDNITMNLHEAVGCLNIFKPKTPTDLETGFGNIPNAY